MKKNSIYLVGVVFCLFLFSCGKDKHNFHYISEKKTCDLLGDIVMSSDSNLNVFYDLTVTDKFTLFLDFFGDTILKAYSNSDLSKLKFIALKGSGPNDFISPYFNKTNYICNDSILNLIDLNSWSLKKMNLLFNKNTNAFVKSESLPANFPPVSECNMMSETIIGTDVDINQNRLFFIYDKKNENIQSIPYYPIVKKKYEQDYLSFLYECKLIANEKENTVYAALKNINVILLYNLNGQLIRTIQIGNEFKYPEIVDKYLDFSKYPKYFTHIDATNQYIYCLYQGGNEERSLSKIFILDWQGKHISTIQTERNLFKIAASPDNAYILGLSIAQDGGTDVIKYQLPDESV